MKRSRVAWFVPLDQAGEPLTSTKSGYFSREVLPFLVDRFDITLCYGGTEGDASQDICGYLGAIRSHEENPYQLFFYQVEDRPELNFSRLHLSLFPGTTLFHDFVIKDSPWNRELAAKQKDLRQPQGEGGESDALLALRESMQSRVLLFSNERNLAEYRRNRGRNLTEEGEEKPCFHLPCPVAPERYRSKHSRMSQRIRLAFCGSPLVEHRAHCLSEALQGVSEEYELMWMIDEAERRDAERIIREFAVQNVRFIYPRDPYIWRKEVAQADKALHLLFSAHGDASPFLPISMMMGVPCVVSDFAAARLLPDSVVLKIEPGKGEVEQLRKAIQLESSSRDLEDMQLRAWQYAMEFHDARVVAEELAYAFSLTC